MSDSTIGLPLCYHRPEALVATANSTFIGVTDEAKHLVLLHSCRAPLA